MRKRRIQPTRTVKPERVSLRLAAQLAGAVNQCGGVPRRQHRPDLRDHPGGRDRPPLGRGLPEDPRSEAIRACVRPRPCHRVVGMPTHLQNADAPGGEQQAPLASSCNTAVFTPGFSATPRTPSPFTRR
jgi:hypothetical protein